MTAKRRILCGEDDVDSCEVMTMLIERSGNIPLPNFSEPPVILALAIYTS